MTPQEAKMKYDLEWAPLPTLLAVAQAQANKWEVQVKDTLSETWLPWCGLFWEEGRKYRGCPKPLKTTVKVLGWFDGDQLFWLKEGVAPKWPSKRVPGEDKVVEVEV